MKKIITVLLLTMAVSLIFSGCSSKEVDYLEKVKEAGVIKLGVAADYPPFEFHKAIDGNDAVVGFDIEIAKKIAEDMGVKLEIIDMQFEGLLPAMAGNKVDMIISGMNPTEERAKSVDFSVVYYDPYQTMLIKADMIDEFNTVEAFIGKDVGVQKSSTQENTAKEQFGDSEIVGLAKIPNLIMELKADKIDAIILESTVANQYANANDDLVVNGLDLGKEGGVAVAIQKDTGAFLDQINVTLQHLIDSGELDQYIIDAKELSEN
jgi:polar amino acid transport system substrate-binding protein